MLRKAHEVEAYLKKPDSAVRVVLIYGKDKGAIREHTRNLSKMTRGEDGDPTLLIEMDDAALSKNSSRLYDEAATISMFGGNKVIELSLVGDTHLKTIESYLQDAIEDTLVIIQSGSLKPTSKLRKLIEKSPNAISLPCFEDNARDIQRIARSFLTNEGFRIEAAALDYLSRLLGSDRGVTMRELERLVLYKGPKGSSARRGEEVCMITMDDIDQAMGDTAAMSLDALIDAICLGQLDEADRAVIRLKAGGTQTHRLLIHLRMHFQRLHLCLSHIQNGASQDIALKSAFRPPLNFKRKPLVAQQLRLWPLRKTETALRILHETGTDCRRTGTPVDALTTQTLLRLTRAAKL